MSEQKMNKNRSGAVTAGRSQEAVTGCDRERSDRLIQLHKDRLDENGQRLVVRNGHLPEREVGSGGGPIPVRQPRVRHRDQGRFTSAILPKYMRRAPSVDALLPALYLKGISTGDFTEALTAILGEGASGLSASNIVRLKSGWETDYKVWCQRDLRRETLRLLVGRRRLL